MRFLIKLNLIGMIILRMILIIRERPSRLRKRKLMATKERKSKVRHDLSKPDSP